MSDEWDWSKTCRVCGFQRGGHYELRCDCDRVQDEAANQRLATLARNLAVAAFGCEVFYLGWEERLQVPAWQPGCGRPAPGCQREAP